MAWPKEPNQEQFQNPSLAVLASMGCCEKIEEALALIVQRLEEIEGENHKDILNVGLDGQTSFALTEEPTTIDLSKLYVNGLLQFYGVDFTISGTMLTWLDNEFTLNTSDILIIFYN